MGTDGERIRFTSKMERMVENKPSSYEVQWYSDTKMVKSETVTSGYVSYMENTETQQYFTLGNNVSLHFKYF